MENKHINKIDNRLFKKESKHTHQMIKPVFVLNECASDCAYSKA